MKRVCALTLLFFLFTLTAVASPPAAEKSKAGSELTAKELLMKCIAAMGGLDRLRSVDSLSYQSLSHTFFRTVEVSESSPQMASYESDEVLLQPQNYNLSEKINSRFTERAAQSASQLIVTPQGGFTESDGKKAAVSANNYYKAVDTLAANPITALLAAYASSDLTLRRQSDETYGVSFHQPVYGLEVKTTLGISERTNLLQWVETDHSYSQDVYSGFWGPTAKKRVFSAWIIDANGIHFPAKWQIEAHGEVEGQESLVNLKINPEVDASSFAIPDEFKNSFESLRKSDEELAKGNHGDGDHLDLHPGVVMLPGKQGAYNALIVKQEKGIVVVEGPYSNANSEYVLQYARKTLPGMPVSSVVTTSHMRWHMAGLPAYAKTHVPIYVLDSNSEAVRSFLTTQTTEVAIRDSDIKFRVVKDRTEIGTGINRMVLIPFRGTTSVRMMAVYFPESKLLFCSDLFMPERWEAAHWTEHLAEIQDLIAREHIEVQQVLGISAIPKDWKELAASIPGTPAEARGAN